MFFNTAMPLVSGDDVKWTMRPGPAPHLRVGRIKRLLSFPGTGALVPFISDMINAWDDLTEDEMSCVEKTLTCTRVAFQRKVDR